MPAATPRIANQPSAATADSLDSPTRYSPSARFTIGTSGATSHQRIPTGIPAAAEPTTTSAAVRSSRVGLIGSPPGRSARHQPEPEARRARVVARHRDANTLHVLKAL